MESIPESSVEGFPLSAQQKKLWSLQRTTLDQPFTASGAIRIEGNLNTALLHQCVERLVTRHEILRTTFIRPAGIKTPFQIVKEAPQFSWSFVDLSMLDTTQQELRIADQFALDNAGHFDLADEPLLRLTLMKLCADVHVLLMSVPSLCADSVTLAKFTEQLSHLYADIEEEPAEVLQYADFAEWQNQLFETDDEHANAAKNHWQHVQKSYGSTLTLPFEARNAQPPEFTANSIVDLSSETSRIAAFASQQGTSVSAVLFACWQAVLWRLIGEPESGFLMYYLSEGRPSEDLSDAFGLYAKYLPIACLLDNEPFITHVRGVTNALEDAHKWQAYFDPGTAANIATSVSYSFEERLATYEAAEVSFSLIEQRASISPFKLNLSCVRSGPALSARLDYNQHVFESEVVTRISGYFHRFLSSVLDSPQCPLGDVEIIDARERRRLLVDLNQTERELDPKFVSKGIHELFEAQVTRTPSALAVVHANQALTYAELNARSNQLAHLLQSRGVRPDVCVGLCMERSVELIVGLLAILKAGGAYVPLNPDHPGDRLALQLAESKAAILITDGTMNSDFVFAGDTVDLDREAAALATYPKDSPSHSTTPENLAYVIYTSGSTGVPKGVSVRHQNLINYTAYVLDRLEVDRPLTFATVSTISADLGNTCIFPALVSGGSLHVIDHETSMEGELLKDYFIKHRIDVLKIVPSHLSALLATQADGRILPKQYLIVGGEALTWDLVQRISPLDHTCRIINHYGPTETTVGSLTFSVEDQSNSRDSFTVPIGRPIANTRCYILDQRKRPVPFGVVGELYIGGAGVASGYLNQPAATAERFIPDPFSDSDSTLYRTGDLVRYLPDDNIEFLGRVDRQVKVRGYRVELDEIEAVLSTYAGVRQAAVTLNRDEADRERIVAYVVCAASSQDELRATLKQKLPDYMLPSAFVFLKSLPLTANGKVDRAALPALEDSRAGLRADFVAPRSVVEKELAGLWANLLKIKAVGIHDNFFELGGHSLLATQLISRMRKQFEMEIPLRSLFETPTVAALAERIEKATADNTAQLLAELEQISDDEAARLLGMENG